MKYMRIATLIVAVLTILCSSGCNRGETKLAGKWKNQTMAETVQFNKDRTGIFEVKDNPALSFTWTMLEDNKVKIDIAYQGKVQTLFGRMDNNTLILEGKGGQALYSRME